MKIIAYNNQTYNNEYIVSLSPEELANILGKYSSSTDGFNKLVDDAMKYGTKLPVSRIYKQHKAVENIKYGDRIQEARKKLLEMVEVLKPIEEIIVEIPTVVHE